ncbi:MAG: hypothetical protein ACPGVH_04935 [Chitinophagales bacterium]
MFFIFLKDTFIAFLVFIVISFFSIFPYLIPWFPAEDSILEIGFPKKYYWVEYYSNGHLLGGWNISNLLFNAFVIWLVVFFLSYLLRTQFQTNK